MAITREERRQEVLELERATRTALTACMRAIVAENGVKRHEEYRMPELINALESVYRAVSEQVALSDPDCTSGKKWPDQLREN